MRLACAVADDPAGALVAGRLRDEGLELVSQPAPATGMVVVVVAPDGERTMLSQRVPLAGGLDLASSTDEWLVASGYLLLEPDAARTLAAAAPGPGRMVVGCAAEDPIRWRAALEAFAPDLVVLNREEARAIAPGDDGSPAAGLARGLDACVVVTGASGAEGVVGGAAVAVSVEPITAPVDTTGAGDAFASALLAALLGAPWPPEPRALEAAMRFAASVAREVTGVVGAQTRVASENWRRLDR